jgi:glycine/D-amino acid oxidase-like deaminating enzyme/nitrite reductase/ring-hydroxylating ferredoxin subunit
MAESARRETYWNATAEEEKAFPRLSGDLTVDTAVIGGGIVGITTARLLKDMGRTVAVLEARRVGRQVTGGSTAKVTSQHGLVYQTLAKKFGEDRARLYAEAQESGVRTIERLAAAHDVACDLKPAAAFAYTQQEANVARIEKEVEIARRLGLPATLVQQTDLPFRVLAACRFDRQAQFHPVRYVAGLAATIPGDGCHVFEDSRATDWDPEHVVTERGTVTARQVVMATHLPLGQVGGYYARAFPQAEPVIAARIRRVPVGMYINVEEPSFSIRTHARDDGDVYGIAAGTSFKPGHVEDERKHFASIEAWLNDHFEAGPVEFRWVNEDYKSMDSAPFIGWSAAPGRGYLVATGFDAWGITTGTAAAMILADLATEGENPWLAIFDARRVKPVAGGAEFIKENAATAVHLVRGHLSRRPESLNELSPGDAAILKLDGKQVAAFSDEQGRVHAVSAVCTHMGCVLGWNETDRTWDCGCHGSRFGLDGDVIHGPAVNPLDIHTRG